MRLLWSLSAIAISATSISAFAPSIQNGSSVATRSNTALNQAVATADVKAKQDATLDKLKAKDAGASAISKDVSIAMLCLGGFVLEGFG